MFLPHCASNLFGYIVVLYRSKTVLWSVKNLGIARTLHKYVRVQTPKLSDESVWFLGVATDSTFENVLVRDSLRYCPFLYSLFIEFSLLNSQKEICS